VPVADLGEAELSQVIQQLVNHFNAARQHLADGNWSKYGEEMDKAQEVINLLQQQYGTQE
jgi:flagellin-specific chaperone FliS